LYIWRPHLKIRMYGHNFWAYLSQMLTIGEKYHGNKRSDTYKKCAQLYLQKCAQL